MENKGMIKGEGRSTFQPKPVAIQVSKVVIHMSIGPKPLVIQTPSSFLYKNNKVVPWIYGVSIVQGEKMRNQLRKGKKKLKTYMELGA